MLKTPFRNIPQTMGTQHPDNANAPYWETDGDGFVSTKEEIDECVSSMRELGCEEYMWDWEGKHVDEGVIEKLLTEHHDFFSKNQIGRDKFLTFRIPNVWEEKGRSLARAFMNMLTADEFARDLKLNTPPLFEMILPMADKANKLIKMQTMFTELAKVKHKLFSDEGKDFTYVNIIPLVEGVREMEKVGNLLDEYFAKHKAYYKSVPPYMRVFFARSDPALVSGLVPAVLANKIALSETYKWSERTNTPVYPWTGAGSLPFRGGLRPNDIDYFLQTYPGLRSVSIQSSFRYDYPLKTVKKAIADLNVRLPKTKARKYSDEELQLLKKINRKMEKPYQETVFAIADEINSVAAYVPSRRERKLHIGLLGYGRKVGRASFPRAIKFTSSLYSLGVPPELIGTGRGLKSLSFKELSMLENAYDTLEVDLQRAGQFLNKENLAFLAKSNKGFAAVKKDVEHIESYLGREIGPSSIESFLHRNWTSTVYFEQKKNRDLSEAIVNAAKQRKSLG